MDATRSYRRVVFLDRDGVVNRPPPEGSWVFRWEDFHFADGALDALRTLRRHGFTVVVVTNQSCVGRGFAELAAIQAIHSRMLAAVGEAGGAIAGVYVCPHVDEDRCPCRKPRPGLIDRAAAELGIDPAGAFLVGDSPRDIQAGAARGCTTILVDAEEAPACEADFTVPDLLEATDLILRLVGDLPREP